MEASLGIDVPCLADILLAILLFADDIALFSCPAAGLYRQLNMLTEFCAARGLPVNVKKTEIFVFEHCKSTRPAFHYQGDDIEQLKYLGMLMHGTKA